MQEPIFGLSSSEFERAFQRERTLAERRQRRFSLVVFMSRCAGRGGLTDLAEILRSELRAYDCVGPIGRAAMAVLMPETDERGANAFAARVIQRVADANLLVDYEVYVYPRSTDDPGSSGEREDDGSSPERRGEADRERVAHNGSAHNGAAVRNGHVTERLNGSAVAQAVAAESSGGGISHGASDGDGPRRDPLGDLSELRTRIGQELASDLEPLLYEPLSLPRRALDILVSGLLLTLMSPLFLLVAILIKLTSPGPVFFVQKRAGQGGVPFNFFKFRSMYVDAEARKAALAERNEQDGPIFKMRNDPRITWIGRWLRRASVDELPQFFNVLRGDMTLVGPRPPTLDEVASYEPWQRRRLCLKGGLTCIWQVSGRSEIGFEDWMRMDIRYAQHRSLSMDLRLLARTAGAVASGRGAY